MVAERKRRRSWIAVTTAVAVAGTATFNHNGELSVCHAAPKAEATRETEAKTPARGEDRATAKRKFKQAEEYFRASKYAEALQEYQAGYDAAPIPGFLVNIGQCHRRLGDLPRARKSFQKFIIVAPDSPLRPEIEKLVAELDKLIEDAAQESGPGAAPTGPALLSTAPPAKTTPQLTLPPLHTHTHSPSSNADLSATHKPQKSEGGTRWIMWGGIATGVLAGVAVALAASQSGGTTLVSEGSIGTLRR